MPAGPGADALLTSFRAVEKNLADRDISPDSPRLAPTRPGSILSSRRSSNARNLWIGSGRNAEGVPSRMIL
ncbi:hypothetical protein SAMN05421870_11477 [Streptomyces qinglanensis]|uniref:Uncharacterized protein n=1 Tax=Streptomyces qinglanensis TaxID=943816 RepID=A0A1H9VZV9_9ACTN|nr:hypothetical protein SAMN05421870_11477 [Streptomyces qinglanensis]